MGSQLIIDIGNLKDHAEDFIEMNVCSALVKALRHSKD